MHGQRRARPRARRAQGPPRPGLRRRRRPRRRRGLAARRVSPRRAGGAHRDRRRKGRLGRVGHNRRSMATKKQKRRRAKEKRHDYVWVDDDGNEVEPDGTTPAEGTGKQSTSRFERDPQAPSWRRTLQAGGDLRADHVRHRVPALARPPDDDEDHADAPHRRDLHPVQLLHRPVLLPLAAVRRRAGRGPETDAPPMLRVEQLSLGPIGTNCYVVRTDATASEAVVVDPSGDATEPAAHARAARDELRRDPRHARALGSPRRRRGPRGGHEAPVYMADGERVAARDPGEPVAPPGVTLRPYVPDVLLAGGETIDARRDRLRGPRPCPGTRRRISRTTPTAACSPATSCSRARSAAPISPGRTGTRFCRRSACWSTRCRPRHGRLPRARPHHDARRRARAESVPRPSSARSAAREPGAEDRASARHPRRHPLRAAAVAPRDVRDRAAVRALRVPADHDARVRGHRALRADVRRRARTSCRRRCTRSRTARTGRSRCGRRAPRRSAGRTSSTGSTASRSRRSSSRSRRCTATARRAKVATASTGRPPSRRSAATTRRSTPSSSSSTTRSSAGSA